ncbi:MAG TPA: PilZ domain-containing protein [Candidatus Omnitrophica bacterium]|nr:PilZ domain-containing protein [Candidatus Omnitrophota bacterium]
MRKKIKTIKAPNRRHFIRHPMCFPLSYKVIHRWQSDDIKEGLSTAINVSRGGLLFSSKQLVKKNSMISLAIPFEHKVFKVKAQVVRCSKDSETGFYNIGVCFKRINDAFKVKLIEQIYLISEYRDLRSLQLGKDISLEEASKEWIKRYSKRFQKLYW